MNTLGEGYQILCLHVFWFNGMKNGKNKFGVAPSPLKKYGKIEYNDFVPFLFFLLLYIFLVSEIPGSCRNVDIACSSKVKILSWFLPILQFYRISSCHILFSDKNVRMSFNLKLYYNIYCISSNSYANSYE